MISFFLWALVCVNCVLLRAYWSVILTFVLYGAHKGAIEPVQKAFVSELVPAQYRAGSLGAFQMVTGLCALPASLFAGLLWDKIGEFLPFLFSFSLTMVAIVMMFFVKEKKRSDNNKG